MENKKKDVGELLSDAGKVFKVKSVEYGDSYKRAGKLLHSFFPDGIELSTTEDFDRFSAFHMCVVKMNRYAENLKRGGHLDSATDLTVYAAILEWKTGETK